MYDLSKKNLEISRTIIETIENIHRNRILHNAFGGTTLSENCMWEMTFSEKYSFEGWILKVNLVWGTKQEEMVSVPP